MSYLKKLSLVIGVALFAATQAATYQYRATAPGVSATQPSCVPGNRKFTASGTFDPLKEAPLCTTFRVLVVGGGGGGASGHMGGGGGGYVAFNQLSNLSASVVVTVGSGGAGAPASNYNEALGRPGQQSSFGSYLSANGGMGTTNVDNSGAAGGSGGGGACNAGNPGGAGGSNGSNGYPCPTQGTLGGAGQGASYAIALSGIPGNKATPGVGGAGGTSSHGGGGGGGGVLLNGIGPQGQNGGVSSSAKGGYGYGAGGGAGGYDGNRNAGGSGADGVVYVEWSA